MRRGDARARAVRDAPEARSGLQQDDPDAASVHAGVRALCGRVPRREHDPREPALEGRWRHLQPDVHGRAAPRDRRRLLHPGREPLARVLAVHAERALHGSDRGRLSRRRGRAGPVLEREPGRSREGAPQRRALRADRPPRRQRPEVGADPRGAARDRSGHRQAARLQRGRAPAGGDPREVCEAGHRREHHRLREAGGRRRERHRGRDGVLRARIPRDGRAAVRLYALIEDHRAGARRRAAAGRVAARRAAVARPRHRSDVDPRAVPDLLDRRVARATRSASCSCRAPSRC